jgi:hypothetical protein
MTIMSMNVADALLRMDEHLCDLRGAFVTLSKLADGCEDDSQLADALFFVAASMSDSTSELQRLWELATDRKPDKDCHHRRGWQRPHYGARLVAADFQMLLRPRFGGAFLCPGRGTLMPSGKWFAPYPRAFDMRSLAPVASAAGAFLCPGQAIRPKCRHGSSSKRRCGRHFPPRLVPVPPGRRDGHRRVGDRSHCLTLPRRPWPRPSAARPC